MENKAFKPPVKKQRTLSDTIKKCPVTSNKSGSEVATGGGNIQERLDLVISRLDVLQECIDVLAAWCIPEDSQEDMVTDLSKES